MAWTANLGVAAVNSVSAPLAYREATCKSKVGSVVS
jgi:hypothetical protein